MKKFVALVIAATLLIPSTSLAATKKATPKPIASESKKVVKKKPAVTKPKKVVKKKPAVTKPKKVVKKKPAVTKPKKVVKKKPVKLEPKSPMKWPPPGFDKKDDLYAKTATPKELLIAGTENKKLQKTLIAQCHQTACLGIFVGSETGCDWWEITSNVLGVNSANPLERVIYGSLITLAPGSAPRKVTTILLVSDEPIADGLGIGAYTANCKIGRPTQKVPSNIYTQTFTR